MIVGSIILGGCIGYAISSSLATHKRSMYELCCAGQEVQAVHTRTTSMELEKQPDLVSDLHSKLGDHFVQLRA